MVADFSWIPTKVIPRAPKHNVLVTPSVSFKKDRVVLDDEVITIYDFEFEGVTDADRNAILSHYHGASGPYAFFIWRSVPSYLNIGTEAREAYYVAGSYKESVKGRSWNISFSFDVGEVAILDMVFSEGIVLGDAISCTIEQIPWFLLKEDGDYLLKEDGDKIILDR